MVPLTLYGALPTGEAVEQCVLSNANGFSAEVINYGATLTSLRVPDRTGKVADVVLGFDNLESYLGPHPFFGAVAGRVAGRISGARFELEGSVYELDPNDPPNHIHGGRVGFDKRLWRMERAAGNGSSVRLTYRSGDGEEGYPGNVEAAVTYTVTGDNALVMETEAASDRATPFSITQHSYFNLAGEGEGTIEDHELQILSGSYAPTDDHMRLLGRREPVGENDLRKPRRIGEALRAIFHSHGDLYFLRAGQREPQLAAQLYEPESGRKLTVSTTEECIQFYSGVSLDGTLTGKSGRKYGRHAGLCLECEGYPDGANTPALGDIILRPGRPLRQKTVYAFSTDS
jgi:aldose 1-epimerase